MYSLKCFENHCDFPLPCIAFNRVNTVKEDVNIIFKMQTASIQAFLNFYFYSRKILVDVMSNKNNKGMNACGKFKMKM